MTGALHRLRAANAWRTVVSSGLLVAAAGAFSAASIAKAAEPTAPASVARGSLQGIDRVAFDNGIRVVLVRTSGTGSLAIVEAFAATRAGDREAIRGALRGSGVVRRGDLTPAERADLLSRRDVTESIVLFADTATRSLTVPPGELPLAAYLLGQSQRPAVFPDDASVLVNQMYEGARPELTPRPDGVEPWGPEGDDLVPVTSRAGAAPLAKDRLTAADVALRQGPLVVVVVGDVDSDRATELLHKFLDEVPAHEREKQPTPGAGSGAVAPTAEDTSPPRQRGGTARGRAQGTHAVGLAVSITGVPSRRRALRAAFEAFVHDRVLAAGGKTSKLSSFRRAERIDRDAGVMHAAAVRLTVADEAAAAALEERLRAEWVRYLAEGPTAAELEAADARVQGRDAAAWRDPAALGRHVALVELAGERWGSPAFAAPQEAITPAKVTPLLAAAFGPSSSSAGVFRERPTP